MGHKAKDTFKLWTVGTTAVLLALLLVWMGPSDPALPEVVYDRDGKPWTQDGERIEEDDPRWEGTRDNDRGQADNARAPLIV